MVYLLQFATDKLRNLISSFWWILSRESHPWLSIYIYIYRYIYTSRYILTKSNFLWELTIIYIFALRREWKAKKIWKLAAYNLFNVSDCIYRNQNYTTWVFKINTTINIQKFNSKLRLHKCLNHQIYLNSKACWLWMSFISAAASL